jgi:predicted MFS family arabinose efflux permease
VPLDILETTMIENRRSQPALWLVLLAAAGTFALTMGTRQTMGLFLSPINTSTGLGLGSISLAFAFGQLFWGLTQPFAGAVADRIGAGRVLLAGVLLVALGTFITPLMTSTVGLIFAIGVLSAGGAGMAGPAVLMAATTRLLPPGRSGLATGIVNAGGSFGQFVMAPIAAALMLGVGWVAALQIMGVIVLVCLPAAFLLRGNSLQAAPAGQKPVGTREAIGTALRTPSYLLLAAGFFVCGFHVAFLATHLPGVVDTCGLPPQWAGWSLAMIGLFNIIGSVGMGWAVGRWRMKSLLSLVYATRAVAVAVFLMAPKTGPVMLLFAAVMGLHHRFHLGPQPAVRRIHLVPHARPCTSAWAGRAPAPGLGQARSRCERRRCGTVASSSLPRRNGGRPAKPGHHDVKRRWMPLRPAGAGPGPAPGAARTPR